jgi:hypothetical protein
MVRIWSSKRGVRGTSPEGLDASGLNMDLAASRARLLYVRTVSMALGIRRNRQSSLAALAAHAVTDLCLPQAVKRSSGLASRA